MKVIVHSNELALKYEDLKKVVKRTEEPNVQYQVESDDVFSPIQLRELEGMSLQKTSDSTFILKCLKFAYQNDLSVLRWKTLNGTTPSTLFVDGCHIDVEGKAALTPEKVARIKQLFIERLSKCDINSVEFGERIKETKVNQLFNSSIKNIAKKC